jgi:Tol biopolymer transport system component
MPAPFCRITCAAAAILAAACNPEQLPTDPSLAKAGTGSGQFTATPNAIEISYPPGGSEVVTVKVQYLTTVTSSSSNTGCATVSPASTPTKKPKDSSAYVATFTVTAASAGSCTITFTDKNGKSGTVPVAVVAPLPDRIVFRADVDGSSEIFVMDLDGSNRTQLTATPDAFELLPELSADGRKIVFISTNENNTSWNPSLMNVDGTSRSVLPLPGIIGRATLSPDRKRVAFTAQVDSRSRIFTSKLDGTDLTQITSGATGPIENDPRWSGSLPGRIAFWREAPRNVWIMNADGTGQLQLTPDNDPWLHGPPTVALSPDGQWVAFDCEPTIHVYDICIVKADGTGKAQLTDADGDDRFPRWTRDGRIIFTSQRDGNREVYIMNADGSGQTNLTNTPGDDWT